MIALNVCCCILEDPQRSAVCCELCKLVQTNLPGFAFYDFYHPKVLLCAVSYPLWAEAEGGNRIIQSG